jgi:DNA-binding response OmpR family regulator
MSLVLIVEDELSIARIVRDYLEHEGFQVEHASDGEAALSAVRRANPDLIVLDLRLPKRDGLDVAREVRKFSEVPIVMVTARGEEADRVAGLELGADDYIVKPFSVKELLARVEAVLRRSPQRPTDVTLVSIPSGVADFSRREIRYTDGSRAELSEREVELLRYLAENNGRAIAREELLENVWRISADGLPTRTIDMHVARLREKLRDDPHEPRVILTVRGKGYAFARPDAASAGADT